MRPRGVDLKGHRSSLLHALRDATGRVQQPRRPVIMRYAVACREQPSENNCTLTIAGEREEVLKAAVEHAISSHGHTDSDELRSAIESALKPEQTASVSSLATST